MSGIVHFKFKSSNTYDSVSFDGAFVSVGELKNLIADKKGLSKDATSELLLSDPRTQAEHSDDSAVIPKSSSVLVRRVPNLHPSSLQKPQATSAAALQNSSLAQPAAASQPPASTSAPDDEFGGDLYSEQRDEDEALTQLLAQTGQQWEKQVKEGASRGRGRGRGLRGRGGFTGRGREPSPAVLPKGYICFRCGQTGHHISDCPSSADPDAKRIRPAVGVPTALLTKSTGGGLLLPDGTTGSLQPNEDAFLKEIGGMPKAQVPPVLEASTSAPKGEKGGEGEKEGSKAIVPVSEGEPALVGSGELGLPGLLMPPEDGMPPWDLSIAPPMPQLPLPGVGDVPLLPNMPLSREDFQRMQEQLRRRKHRVHKQSGSRSPPRRDDRRRRVRESRSPRRQESPRRTHRSRRWLDRSSSEERRPRRRSPTPPFIQLRKRSNSPKSRRRRTSRSRTPPLQLRRKESKSPQRHRSRRRDSTRWHPEEAASPAHQSKGSAGQPPQDEFHAGDGFDSSPKAADGTQAASTSGRAVKGPAADFSVPELMDEPNASFFWRDEAPNGGKGMPPASKNKTAGAGSALSRLQRGVGSRWKAEDEEEAAGKAKAGGVEQDSGRDPSGAALGTRSFETGEAEMAVQRRGEKRRRGPFPGPTSPDTGGKPAEADTTKGGTLPKTFSIPLEPASEKKEKKSKRGKEKKEKDSKRKRKLSPKDGAEAGETTAEETGLEAVGAYNSSAPDTEQTTTASRQFSSSQGTGKRVRSDSTQDIKGDSASEVDDAVKTRGRDDAQFAQAAWEKSPFKPAAARMTSSEAMGNGQSKPKSQPEEEAYWAEKEKKSHKHKHKHKHSKKRHKDD